MTKKWRVLSPVFQGVINFKLNCKQLSKLFLSFVLCPFSFVLQLTLIRQLKLMVITLFFALMLVTPVAAKEIPIEVKISLGNSAGELRFFPDNLEFLAGKSYKLILDNPSNQKHYFTAKDFADAIWTRKVDAGNVEIKGAIHELEIRPGAVAQWVFTPMKVGDYDLYCSIPGHKEAGMVGKIAIKNAD